MATATTLVTFNGADGSDPDSTLVMDAQGDLFGETAAGGAEGFGTVFEIPLGPDGYASTPVDLTSFNRTDGAQPYGNLVLDAAGDIFGTTSDGGLGGGGTVFEIANTGSGYSSQPVTLATFDDSGSTTAGAGDALVADAAGDLFGFVNLHNPEFQDGQSTIYELVKTSSGYSGPVTIATDPGSALDVIGLAIDQAGNIFASGVFVSTGTNSIASSIIELEKTSSGYYVLPPTIDDLPPYIDPGIAIDKADDVFVYDSFDNSASGFGNSLDEFVHSSGGYSLTSLVNTISSLLPNAPSGPYPTLDAAGDIFDAAYELPATAQGYASQTMALPEGTTSGFVADSSGDLFGVQSSGGAAVDGSVFELTNTGYVIGSGPDILSLSVSEDAYFGDAHFTIDVNNQQVGGVFTATALHATGQTQRIALAGYFGATNTVTIDFLNDAYAGTPQTDRNLYVDGATVTYPGATATITSQTIAGSTLSLYSQGPQSFTFATPGYAPPAPVSIGTGSDDLALAVSEDAYNGDAQYTIAVDGQPVGGTLTATPLATHGTGEAQTVNVLANFAPGTHTVSVDFLNDAYAGLGQDRNLYVEGSSINGGAVPGGSLTLLSQGTQSFNFIVPAH